MLYRYLLWILLVCSVGGGHVLMYHPWSTRSHRQQNNALLEGLLARGHRVTGVVPQSTHFNNINYTEIIVEDRSVGQPPPAHHCPG